MTPPTVRVRFAPSPTGYLHVGGARTALFNWLFARQKGGAFLLRIEDTDKARSTDESTRAIFDGLTWLGLTWDEQVVYQGANLARHRTDANRLLHSGHAYRCFCSAAELEYRRAEATARGEAFRYDRRCDHLDAAEKERRAAAHLPFVIRFRVPEGITSWNDMVHEDVSFPNKDVDDFVILRSDATPIYNLAVVSDDIAMRISHVMRGDDHISNTPKQILLYHALGAMLPRFAHFPMIHGLDGKKLSKRHGATAVSDYQHMGILPQAMNNFLALLGWSPGEDRELMTMDDMVQLFSEDRLLRKASVFDPKKLEWMNGQHLIRMTGAELVTTTTTAPAGSTPQAIALAEIAKALNPAELARALDFVKDRARTTDELLPMALRYVPGAPFAIDAGLVDTHLRTNAAEKGLLVEASAVLGELTDWSQPTVESALRSTAERLGVSPGKLFQPMRIALTGSNASPGIFEVLVHLGPEVSLQRLRDALAMIGA